MRKLLTMLTIVALAFTTTFTNVQAKALTYVSQQPVKKNGTPDKRYNANKHLKKDGTMDMRYKTSKKAVSKTTVRKKS
ncbi:hypothetical protein [Mucilaginibacter sp. UYCu711]|uniref:hypothetical protein n=1 Tax=Mucilaginibacter sp. UYCu711 TaxID=3156339 RepID=UPI003D1EF94C